jgi:AraC-like DNA-binding protein
MCITYVREIAMVELGLEEQEPTAWFRRRRTTSVRGWEGNDPAEQYMLGFMLEVVRLAAGPNWIPARLQLESPASGWGSSTEAFPGTRIEFGRPWLAVGIPRPWLSLPLPEPPSDVVSEAGAAELPADTFAKSLRQSLLGMKSETLPTEEQAAELIRLSPRTLRRKLAAESTSWRELVHDMRYRRAVMLLQEGRSVQEISEALGYSYPHHFTRFFRARTGLSPSAYRREIERASGSALPA